MSTEDDAADAELVEPLRRVYVPHTQFRGPCQVCGEQIGFHHQRQEVVAVHVDARSTPMLVGGRRVRARCLGSMRPPA